jgi:hypothetical protein
VEDKGIHEQRRYSCVLLSHPQLDSFASVRRLLGAKIAASKKLVTTDPTWRVCRFEYINARSLYPATNTIVETRERPGGYAHDLYLGSQDTIGNEEYPSLFVASPYVRLLSAFMGSIRHSLGNAEATTYYAVHMQTVYDRVETSESSVSVTRVTLQMLNEPELELVSLTGRNPLHSTLHRAIKDVAAPYSLRAEIRGADGRPVRVNVDRHGNLWWHQTDDAKIAQPITLINSLISLNALKPTRNFPLDRADDEDQ